jgi:hypothetical protein
VHSRDQRQHGPLGPDLARITEKFKIPEVRADLESIGVHDPFEFLAHFVLADDEVGEFAGPGPLVTDDHTRLDFTVPRSLDSSYGFANANTNSWLGALIDPASKKTLACAASSSARPADGAVHKRPVPPHLSTLNPPVAPLTTARPSRRRGEGCAARIDGRADGRGGGQLTVVPLAARAERSGACRDPKRASSREHSPPLSPPPRRGRCGRGSCPRTICRVTPRASRRCRTRTCC